MFLLCGLLQVRILILGLKCQLPGNHSVLVKSCFFLMALADNHKRK